MYDTATTAVLLFLIATLYLLPTILAYGRDHPRRQQLGLMNILFGWTLIGWVATFLWAMLADTAEDEP
jgi:hypothetical protein